MNEKDLPINYRALSEPYDPTKHGPETVRNCALTVTITPDEKLASLIRRVNEIGQ